MLLSRSLHKLCTHVLGGQLLLPRQVYDRSCPTSPCDAGTFLNRGLHSIVSAKDALPIPLRKQIFVLSEAIPLLFLQNHQFWPLETLPQGEEIPFFLNRSSSYHPWVCHLAILTISFQAPWLSCIKLLKLSHIPTTSAIVKKRKIPLFLPFLLFG